MLGPYGHGTYTAMQYWQQNSVCNVGTRASATELSNAGKIVWLVLNVFCGFVVCVGLLLLCCCFVVVCTET